ncbi:hypothetical protein EGH21_11830 [Halomicroarcula sp. F13]|uniref:Uncharacterized protein n=1 Tax=Haloarcula rubra TaxID=2487747 RepID=A0AAW4PRF8_9EURY|nr:hypothetical protein [Halomicroarcula rubra]MBX0323717.1 hypothetical protein [Halomicroarcula rubra]
MQAVQYTDRTRRAIHGDSAGPALELPAVSERGDSATGVVGPDGESGV